MREVNVCRPTRRSGALRPRGLGRLEAQSARRVPHGLLVRTAWWTRRSGAPRCDCLRPRCRCPRCCLRWARRAVRRSGYAGSSGQRLPWVTWWQTGWSRRRPHLPRRAQGSRAGRDRVAIPTDSAFVDATCGSSLSGRGRETDPPIAWEKQAMCRKRTGCPRDEPRATLRRMNHALRVLAGLLGVVGILACGGTTVTEKPDGGGGASGDDGPEPGAGLDCNDGTGDKNCCDSSIANQPCSAPGSMCWTVCIATTSGLVTPGARGRLYCLGGPLAGGQGNFPVHTRRCRDISRGRVLSMKAMSFGPRTLRPRV